MKTLERLIEEQTYMVTDSKTNRFNFFGLIEIDLCFVATLEGLEGGTEWDLAGSMPEDVKKAIAVMAENSVVLEEYTGVVTFGVGVETYYLLTW